MSKIIPDLRFTVMQIMIYVVDHDICFSLENMGASGTLRDIDCTWEDAALAIRESVGIGHAERHGPYGCYRPTQAGRDWVAAEEAVRQSRADAAERIAITHHADETDA